MFSTCPAGHRPGSHRGQFLAGVQTQTVSHDTGLDIHG